MPKFLMLKITEKQAEGLSYALAFAADEAAEIAKHAQHNVGDAQDRKALIDKAKSYQRTFDVIQDKISAERRKVADIPTF